MIIKKRTLIHNLIHNRISMFTSTLFRETLRFSKDITVQTYTKIQSIIFFFHFKFPYQLILFCNCIIFMAWTLCASRKYPYPPWMFFSFYPPPRWNFPSRGSFVEPPTPQEFPFFGGGSFFKLTAFISLNKSENTSFIFTQPLLIICCSHYNNILVRLCSVHSR